MRSGGGCAPLCIGARTARGCSGTVRSARRRVRAEATLKVTGVPGAPGRTRLNHPLTRRWGSVASAFSRSWKSLASKLQRVEDDLRLGIWWQEAAIEDEEQLVASSGWGPIDDQERADGGRMPNSPFTSRAQA